MELFVFTVVSAVAAARGHTHDEEWEERPSGASARRYLAVCRASACRRVDIVKSASFPAANSPLIGGNSAALRFSCCDTLISVLETPLALGSFAGTCFRRGGRARHEMPLPTQGAKWSHLGA